MKEYLKTLFIEIPLAMLVGFWALCLATAAMFGLAVLICWMFH